MVNETPPPAPSNPSAIRTHVAHVVEILALLSIAAMLAGLLGRWHFALDLASHFRVQAMAALLVAAPLLLVLRSRKWAAVSFTAGCFLLVSLCSYWWPAAASTSTGTYRLMTMNVRTDNPLHDQAIKAILAHDPDFIVLQETDAAWIASLDEALAAAWPHRQRVPRSDNFGIALYSKLPWSSCELVEFTDQLPTPALDARFELADGQRLRLIGTHPLPPMNARLWESRNAAFAGLARAVAQAEPERTIVAGDLNCSPWSPWFGKLLRESGLRDSAAGRGLGSTWYPLPWALPLCGLPIDHVLVGDEIGVTGRAIGPDIGSDHRAVIVDFP